MSVRWVDGNPPLTEAELRLRRWRIWWEEFVAHNDGRWAMVPPDARNDSSDGWAPGRSNGSCPGRSVKLGSKLGCSAAGAGCSNREVVPTRRVEVQVGDHAVFVRMDP